MTGREVFEAAGRRARRLRALSAGSFVLAIAALAAVASALMGRFLLGWFVSLPQAAALAGAAWLMFAGAFGFTYGNRPDLARVLLRMDYRMGLDARLSALYELERRSPTSFLRRRLETALAGQFAQWRTGLPVSRWAVAGIVAGILSTAGILTLGGLGDPASMPTPDTTTQALYETAGASSEEGEVEATVGNTAEGAQVTAAGDAGGLPGLLAELGRNLNQAEAADTMRAVEAGWDDEFRSSLESWAEQLQDRIVRTENPLTAEERTVLAQASADAPPAAKKALEEVLEAATTSELNQALRGLLDALHLPELAEEEGASDPTRVPDESVSSEGGAPGSARPLAMPDTGAPGGTVTRAEDGDGAQSTGGEQETSPSGQHSNQASASYVREDAPTAVSDEGEVRAYLTLGVPIELEPDEEGTASPRVDYDRLDSILEARNLPASAADIVREYFETISEGGS